MNVIKLYNLYMENLRDHPTKHSSLSHDEKFCTLKAKVSLIEVQVNLTEKQSFTQIVIILLGETLPGKIFVGRNFYHFSKNLSLLPDKISPYKVLLFRPILIEYF